MITLILLCSFTSFSGAWLSDADQYDFNNDGIVNLKDWAIMRDHDITILQREPDPNDVEDFVLKAYKSGNMSKLLAALCEEQDIAMTYSHVDNDIYVRLDWDDGWFWLKWRYTLFRYEFVYEYGSN
jgi:hypothetical protein